MAEIPKDRGPKDRGPADHAWVNMDEDQEVRFWSKKFHVTPDRLRAAVDEVGPSAEAVARQLGKGRPQ